MCQSKMCLSHLKSKMCQSKMCQSKLSFERVISGSIKGELIIWCLETNSCIKIIKALSDAITGIQILSNDKFVICSHDKTIKVLALTSATIFFRENMIFSN